MTDLKYVMCVLTPEDCRREIVKWLREQSTQISSQARIANRVKEKHTLLAKSIAYHEAANFIERIVIESPVVDPLKELDKNFLEKD